MKRQSTSKGGFENDELSTENKSTTEEKVCSSSNAERSAKKSKNKETKIESPREDSSVPIFLSQTYKMFQECEQSIARWTADGDMIEILNQEQFEQQVIPNYFGHNNFSSFARQLNFYGFRKVPTLVMRNTDPTCNDKKVVTFQNQNFKRDKPELMKSIKRSTRTGQNDVSNQQEVEKLKRRLEEMESMMSSLTDTFDHKLKELQTYYRKRIEELRSMNEQYGNDSSGLFEDFENHDEKVNHWEMEDWKGSNDRY